MMILHPGKDLSEKPERKSPKRKVALPPEADAKYRRSTDYIRAKAMKILELRTQGHSFDEIADILDYKNGKHVQLAYKRLMDRFEKEDIDHLRTLQNERLEMAWSGLAPKIIQGRERAVEVGIKVLERQAKLQGLDAADQTVEKTTGQQIQINIMPHPGDLKAQSMVIEQSPERPALEEPKNKSGDL
jgi:DNA-binding transcriptional MerR regulator